MMNRLYSVRFTLEAKSDLERLYGFLAEQDITAAEKTPDVIDHSWLVLEEFPFTCRRADQADPFLRELLILFGDAGYVALFEVGDDHTITVIAVRHQREDDYL